MTYNWGHVLPGAAEQVVERMRHAYLDGVRLVRPPADAAARHQLSVHTVGGVISAGEPIMLLTWSPALRHHNF
jgi:hypothetical protein